MRFMAAWHPSKVGWGIWDRDQRAWAPQPVFGHEQAARGVAATLNQREIELFWEQFHNVAPAATR